MTKRTPDSRTRERALYQYSSALLRGDFDTIDAVLATAESDSVLAGMILELDRAYEEEQAREAQFEQDKTIVSSLLKQHLTSSDPAEPEEVPEVTVGEVVSRLHADRAIPKADLLVSQKLQNSSIPVPHSPSARSLKELAASLALPLSERFWKVFRDTAILLGLRTSQQLNYAAARKQRAQRPSSSKPQEKGRGSDG